MRKQYLVTNPKDRFSQDEAHITGDFLFGLRFYAPVKNYGHVETVSSPNHNFFLCKLD